MLTLVSWLNAVLIGTSFVGGQPGEIRTRIFYLEYVKLKW